MATPDHLLESSRELTEGILWHVFRRHLFIQYRFVRVGFWQNGFFRGFLFLARRIFSRILSPDFFSFFYGKKCPEKSSRKIPGKILQNLHNKKSPTHFCRGAGPRFGVWKCPGSLALPPKTGTTSLDPLVRDLVSAGLGFGTLSHGVSRSVCAPLCCKSSCSASRGSSWTMLKGRASAAPETRKPGQSVRAESTQGVFPWEHRVCQRQHWIKISLPVASLPYLCISHVMA